MAFEFRPGDLRAEFRAKDGLIGRAGEGRDAAEFDMRLHQPPSPGRRIGAAAEELGMDQVDRARH